MNIKKEQYDGYVRGFSSGQYCETLISHGNSLLMYFKSFNRGNRLVRSCSWIIDKSISLRCPPKCSQGIIQCPNLGYQLRKCCSNDDERLFILTFSKRNQIIFMHLIRKTSTFWFPYFSLVFLIVLIYIYFVIIFRKKDSPSAEDESSNRSGNKGCSRCPGHRGRIGKQHIRF